MALLLRCNWTIGNGGSTGQGPFKIWSDLTSRLLRILSTGVINQSNFLVNRSITVLCHAFW